MKLYSPATVKMLIEKHKFHFQKSLGQNFLIDGNIVNKIVEAAGIEQDDVVLEIGAGIGTLTRALSKKAKKVIVIEIDKNLLPILDETLAGCTNVEIVVGNALKLNFDDTVFEKTKGEYGANEKKYKIVANLPYYITTPLIMHALESHFNVSLLVLMVQKEVAQRMMASPGTKEYGALTVSLNYYSEPSQIMRVPKTVFMPPPDVESAVVKIKTRDKPPVPVKDEKIFFQIVRAAFGQRRKTLINALLGIEKDMDKEQIALGLKEIGIDPGRRGETLDIEEFAKIANMFFSL